LVTDQEIRRRAAAIKLVLLDVDGVLTDGKLYLGKDGAEMRAFYVRDGLAIRLGQSVGMEFGILSGRDSPLVDQRAAELKIKHVHQGVHAKGQRFDRIASDTGLKPDEICFVGDDLIDVPAMRRAGLAATPADGCEETRQYAHYVCKNRGGQGAVREVIDLILRSSGRWDSAMERFLI
jgi:3-deoxy-D-manno-octulosonate 8-phosphate phosphatase (KDO 8-P phosphatase)